jgi:hypothetical protein
VQCLAPGGRYLNLGELAGGAVTFESGWLRHGGLTLTGFSGTLVTPGQGAEAWAAQAQSPGAKVVVTF